MKSAPKQNLIAYRDYDSAIGTLTIAATEEGLKGLWLDGQKYFAQGYEQSLEANASASTTANAHITQHLDDATRWLDAYFAGKQPALDEVVLAPEGSEFRKLIWKFLCEIPYGEVATYGELAKKAAKELGKERMSAQATGGAVGHNPISIIIPCHRVVGANGSLTGYAGGISRKLTLLKHEGVDCSGFFTPAKSTAP